KRVAAGGMRGFVKETRDDKLVAGSVNGAPVAEWHAGFGDGEFETEIGDEKRGKVEGIHLSGGLRRNARAAVKRFDGGRRAAMTPGDQMTLRVQAGLQDVASGRAVEIVADVVFAGPDDLNGSAGTARDEGGFHGVIVNDAAAGATADECDVYFDVIARN